MTFKMESFPHDQLPWGDVGPLFVDRAVHRELGVCVTSNQQHVWFIAKSGSAVAGFAAAEVVKGVAHFRHAYVVPAFRGNGVYRSLLVARELFVANQTSATGMKTTAAPSSAGILTAAGWGVIKTNGKYAMMSKEVNRE